MLNEKSPASDLTPATFQWPWRELLHIVAPLPVSQCLETIEIFTTAEALREERSVPIRTLGETLEISKLPVKIDSPMATKELVFDAEEGKEETFVDIILRTLKL